MKKLQYIADAAWLATAMGWIFTTGTPHIAFAIACFVASALSLWCWARNRPNGPLFKFHASFKIDRKPRA